MRGEDTFGCLSPESVDRCVAITLLEDIEVWSFAYCGDIDNE